MNKYHLTLQKILDKGRGQENKKGAIKYLLNYVLTLKPLDLLEIFEGHPMARKKLKDELNLFMAGERLTEAYREAGIPWWDYCGPILVNSYPTYFEQLPQLIKKINKEKRSSKNYVLFLGPTTRKATSSLLVFNPISDRKREVGLKRLPAQLGRLAGAAGRHLPPLPHQ